MLKLYKALPPILGISIVLLAGIVYIIMPRSHTPQWCSDISDISGLG